MTNRRRNGIVVGLLAMATLYQLTVVLNGDVRVWASRVWRTQGTTAMQRSALFLLGDRGARFMQFLRTTIPADGTVVIPENADWFSQQNILQYFLLPRGILSCRCAPPADIGPGSVCNTCLHTPGYFIPAIGDFPPEAVAQDMPVFVPFPEKVGWYHGVYFTSSVLPPEANQADRQEFSLAAALSLDLLIISALLILGAALAIAVAGRIDVMELLALGLPLGGGLLTWGVFLVSWAGVWITVSTYIMMGAILLFVAGSIAWRDGDLRTMAVLAKKRANRPRSNRGTMAVSSALVVTACLVLGIELVISAGRSYSIFDDMAIWSLKGYAIAAEKSIMAGQSWGGHGLAYPMNLPLLIGMFRQADGDVIPGSKLLFPLYGASLLIGCYRTWRRQGIPRSAGLTSVLFLQTIPVIFTHSTIGFANLPFTAYIVLGTLWCIEGLQEGRWRIAVVGAMMLGLAGWTRPEGIGFGVAILLALVGAIVLGRRKIQLSPLWLAPALIIPGVWLFFAHGYVAGDQAGRALQQFAQAVAQGRLPVAGLQRIGGFFVGRVASLQIWGFLWLAVVLLAFVGARGHSLSSNAVPLMATVAAVVAWIFPVGLFFVASLSEPDFATFLDVSFDRAFLPAAFLMTSAALIWAFRGPSVSTALEPSTALFAGD
jgi:hypothetical protein